MQAVSKWECDAGMPDISQIVPLARVLGVSSDALLGLEIQEQDYGLEQLREKIGHHGISFGESEAKRIYNLSTEYFATYPTNAQVAFWCLESLVEMTVLRGTEIDKKQFIDECERYQNCILRYEKDADRLSAHHFIMARAYKYAGEADKAEKITEKLPMLFGDKTYWEAEFAFADNDMELALKKCKKSFA